MADDEGNSFTLPQAIRLVTKTRPARSTFTIAVRLPKANGQTVLAHRKGEHVHIDHVWRQGKRVF